MILRRGPREHFHLIAWDLASDAFERGQWLRGYVRLADLSADGARLLYWAAQHHRPRSRPGAERQDEPPPSPAPVRSGRKVPRYLRQQRAPVSEHKYAFGFSTWTAISKPPFFTALAIWPSLGAWTGGGCFAEDGAICVAELGLEPICSAGPPDAPIRALPIRTEIKRSARVGRIDASAAEANVALALEMAGARRVHWVDLDPVAGLSFACDGRVYRAQCEAGAGPEQIALSGRLIAGFTGLVFEQIRRREHGLTW